MAATSLSNGWTARSLMPSYAAVSGILNRPQQPTTAPAATPDSTPAAMPLAGNQSALLQAILGGGFLGGYGQPTQIGGQAQGAGNDAYSNYLNYTRGYAETMSPEEKLFGQYSWLSRQPGATQNFAPLGGWSNFGGSGRTQYERENAQNASVLEDLLKSHSFSPYAYAYGTQAAAPPGGQGGQPARPSSAAPQWGGFSSGRLALPSF